MVGNSYLGITSGLPVIHCRSSSDHIYAANYRIDGLLGLAVWASPLTDIFSKHRVSAILAPRDRPRR